MIVQFIRKHDQQAPGSTLHVHPKVGAALVRRGIAKEIEQAIATPVSETADIKPVRKVRKARKDKSNGQV